MVVAALFVGIVAPLSHALAQSGQRAALVIGNAAYPDSDAPLTTPAGDVRLVKAQLEQQGYTVTLADNLAKATLADTAERFIAGLESGATVFVYFTGYAIQSGRQNYLVPVDGGIWTEADVPRHGLGLGRLLSEIDRRGAATTFVALDAAFRNPFERRFRAYSTGLAPIAMLAQSATIIYSTSPGSVQRQTGGTTSVFATELARVIGATGRISKQVFETARQAVSDATGGEQTPWVFSSAREVASVAPTPPVVTPAPPATPPAPVPTPTPEKPPLRPSQAPEPPKPESLKPEPPRPEQQRPAPVRPAPEQRREQQAAIPALKPMPEEPPRPVPVLPDPAETAFRQAQATGTRQAYEDFLQAFGASTRAEEARLALARLEPPPVKPDRPTLPYSTDDEKVLADLTAAIRRNASDVPSIYTRGQLYAMHYDFGRAASDFDQVIRLNPKDVEALNNRCWVRAILDDVEGALSDCNAAIGLRPNFLDALDSRGFVFLKIGLPRRAIEDYDAALKVNANHASALYGRGLARMRMGEAARGQQDVKAGLAVNAGIADEFAAFGLRRDP